MATVVSDPRQMIEQLEQARKLALRDPTIYSQIVPALIPIIGNRAALEVRRWGADFIAETFASPNVTALQKEELASNAVPFLRSILEQQPEDDVSVRSAVQACASIYSHVFKKITSHPDQALLWQDVNIIKSNILRRIDSAPAAVRICCIKFLQKVVQVQTPGHIADPRKQEQNETSIALVSRNHPLLPLQQIEAETSAILDRILDVLLQNSLDPLTVPATINCLAVLIKTRPVVSNKILSVVLNYNPFRGAEQPLTPRQMVNLKALERTTSMILSWVVKFLPNHPMKEKCQRQIMRLRSVKAQVMDEQQNQSLKRPAEPNDGLDDNKRRKLDPPYKFPILGPAPHTVGQMFTLTEDTNLQKFDVRILPADLVCNISSALLQHIDSMSLDEAVAEVSRRFRQVEAASQVATMDEDQEDYDPEQVGTPDAGADPMAVAQVELPPPPFELGPFKLPIPPPLTQDEAASIAEASTLSVFELAVSEREKQLVVDKRNGTKVAHTSSQDDKTWFPLLIRLATRSTAGLKTYAETLTVESLPDMKLEDSDEEGETPDPSIYDNPTQIRRILYDYVIDDWRRRLSLAVSWLTEEWYADKIRPCALVRASTGDENRVTNLPQATSLTKANPSTPNYDTWLQKLASHIVPLIDPGDKKTLVIFLSELPSLPPLMFEQLRRLTEEPTTVDVCIYGLKYLYAMRPPVRTLVVNTMIQIWERGDESVKAVSAKELKVWQPGFLEENQAGDEKMINGLGGKVSP